jgi:superfamily I DNA/RNA helicase
MKEGETLGNFILTWKQPTNPNQIECSTIHSFKGLERPIVILVEVEQMAETDRDKLLYIGLSRAVHHIVVIGNLLIA